MSLGRSLFVDNLQRVTCDPGRPETLVREAYLLSQVYTTPGTLALAQVARDAGAWLVSDNGNWTRAGRIVAACDAALARWRASPTGEHLAEARAAVTSAAEAATGVIAWDEVEREQRALGARWVIGPEDLRMVAMLRAGLADDAAPDELVDLQRSTIRRWAAARGAWAPGQLLCVLHGADGRTAHRAATELAAIDPDAPAAVSVGVAMTSRRSVDRVARVGGDVVLPARLPEKYLRAAAIVEGALAGLGRPAHVHVLGAASPVLLCVFGLVAPRVGGFSVDSSAPVQDAQDGWLYGLDVAPMKMRLEKLVAVLVARGEAYDADDPFWRGFSARYPHDWDGLRRHLGEPSSIESARARLRDDPSAYRRFVPFFAPLGSTTEPFYADLLVARAGANTWVLQRIAAAIRARVSRPDALVAWVDEQVARYTAHADPRWAEATRVAADILRPRTTPRRRPSMPIANLATAHARRVARTLSAGLAGIDAAGPAWRAAAIDVAAAAADHTRIAGVVGPGAALDRLGDVLPRYAGEITTAPPPGAARPRLSRMLATTSLLLTQAAWGEGRELRGAAGPTVGLLRRVERAEAAMDDALAALRDAALRTDLERLAAAAADLTELHGVVTRLCLDAAAAPDAHQALHRSGLRASFLARELAVAWAAVPVLEARLADARLRERTDDIARRRTRLVRRDGPRLPAHATLPPLPERTGVAVAGRVEAMAWIDRPDAPYAWAQLDTGTRVVLPQKHFRSRGVAIGAYIHAAGRLKRDFADLGAVVEIEAEGPGQHDEAVWRDWLAVQVRDAIEASPGSLRLWWEMPPPEDRAAVLHDVQAHLPGRTS